MKLAVVFLFITLFTLIECQLKKKILKKVIKNGVKLNEILEILKRNDGCCCHEKEKEKVILVTGGYGSDNTTEVLDATGNHVCFLAQLPHPRIGQSQFSHTACGGFYTDVEKTCTKFEGGNWVDATPYNEIDEDYSLIDPRYAAITWPTHYGDYLIAGNLATTTERIYGGETELVSYFPELSTIFSCGIALDDYVIITGGRTSYDRVLAIDKDGYDTYLPDLNIGRAAHGCGHYKNDYDQTILLVVSGWDENGNILTSTEIYNFGAGASSWYETDPYPIGVSWPIGITIDNTLIMTGGYEYNIDENEYGPIDDTYIWNPYTESWEGPGHMGAPRQGQGLSLVKKDSVYPYCRAYPEEDNKKAISNKQEPSNDPTKIEN